MNFASPTFAALVAAYQVLCAHLDALQQERASAGHVTLGDEDDELAAAFRLVRQARIARRHLHDLLRDLVAAAVRNGEPRSAIVDHLRADLDELVTHHTLVPDAALVDEITSWVLEVYPGERAKADFAGMS